MRKVILVPVLLGVMGVGGALALTGNLTGLAVDDKLLSFEEVEKKALAEVNGTIQEIEFDKEFTKPVYEIEIVTDDSEYDLKYDAVTGKLLKKKHETRDDYDDDIQAKQPAEQNAISEQQAIEIALKEVNGHVSVIKLENSVYELEIKDGLFEYEIVIDSNTGSILKIEKESLF